MYTEEPLDFEFEDPLFLTPTRPPNAKRRKVIGLDDLLTDHYKEEHKSAERIRQRDASNSCSSDKNNDYKQTTKERVVSKLVDDCHDKVHAMGDEVEIPLWGLRVFGCQKEKTLVNFKELPHNCKLLQTLSQDNDNGILELGIKKELAEGDFLESLLKNGWLFNLVCACGCLEEPLASWIFNQMLYSSNEELHSSACDFWCGILSSNKINPHLIQLDWFPKYSEIKYALEVYGYIYICDDYSASVKLMQDDSGFVSPPLNLKSWIKFVSALCQSGKLWPSISTSEAEELLSTLISFFLDRQLEGITFLLVECLRSILGFFAEDEWCASCMNVANSITCRYRIINDLNALRFVECISQVDARSKNLRSELAYQILTRCFFEQHVVRPKPKEILKIMTSIKIKDENCDFLKLYICLVLGENWLCGDLALEDKTVVLQMWGKYLRACSNKITSTDWRPYASKVRNRASYLLQTANPTES